jgi:ribose 5-phosphate isomerase B
LWCTITFFIGKVFDTEKDFFEMKVALASDHAGFEVKEELKPLLNELGVKVEDFGAISEDSVDYPDYAKRVAEAVTNGEVNQGVLICGSGIGMAISANKIDGIRAALAWNEETARLARQHNDANVLTIGSRTTPKDEIPKIVRAWFDAKFEGGRHQRRVEKIMELEKHEGVKG